MTRSDPEAKPMLSRPSAFLNDWRAHRALPHKRDQHGRGDAGTNGTREKKMRAARKLGEDEGLSQDEIAFYDAREPIFEGRNKAQFCPAETVSSFSSR
jgi:hypothetical protein